jgi:exodeoxyribonuclease VIII
MNHAEYTAIPGLNWSTLKHLAKSPKAYQHRLVEPEPETDAYLLGRALHCMVLEAPRFTAEYRPLPGFGDMRTKAAKEAKSAWEADRLPGVTYMDIDDFALVASMGAAVMEHRIARGLLANVRTEELVTWTDAETGLTCKGRLDCIGPEGITDLKSARRVGRLYLNDAADYLYHGQLAFYHDGAIAAGKLAPDARLPCLVAVEKSAPFDVQCLRMTEETLAAGRALYRACLRRFQECEAAQVWPGVAPDLQDWTLPPWAAGLAEASLPPEEESF